MSDTPETDEIALHPATTDWVWREHSRKLERERDAYKRAKQENDERFMLERDEARRERDEALEQAHLSNVDFFQAAMDRSSIQQERDEWRECAERFYEIADRVELHMAKDLVAKFERLKESSK